MKSLVALIITMIAVTRINAQTGPDNLAGIPDTLLLRASVITHLYNVEVEVDNLDKANVQVHRIFTVLNEEGEDALLFTEYSTRYSLLNDAEIRVYDKNGRQTGKYKKKDMTSTSVGESLIEDGVMTYFKITTVSYPVTVDLKYELKLKNTLQLPDFRFLNEKESLVEANYTLRVPSAMSIRYRPKLTSLSPVISEDGSTRVYKWTARNIPPLEEEEGSIVRSERYPYISLVSNTFSYYGLHGDLSSWKNFGLWIRDLYKGLDDLPEDRQVFFQTMVKDANGQTEKIKILYHYLQENFRYVSIQLGLGGLQPFSATFTDKNKYGDCKALSNYLKAVLKCVGIKSFVGIINAEYNDESVDSSFPSNGFNHVILCVPNGKDSVWLECTSNSIEPGFLGSFTENRMALLITDEGGVLVPTPVSESSSNRMTSSTLIIMDNDLSAHSETLIETTGSYNGIMNDLLKENRDEQKKTLVFFLGYKQPIDFDLSKSITGTNKANLKMDLGQLPEFHSGNEYFIRPRLNKMWTSKLHDTKRRRMDYYFHYPFEKRDTTIIKLPINIKPDVLPAEKELKTINSYYHSRSWSNPSENAIYTETTLILRKHKIPAGEFESIRAFFDEIILDDTQRIVIKKME